MSKRSENSTILGFIGVLLPIIGFIIIYILDKKDSRAMFYAKQGLVLGIAAILISIALRLVSFIPPVHAIASLILWVGWTVFWIIGLIYSLYHEQKEIPVIGEIARKF